MGHLPIPVKRHDGITQYRQEIFDDYGIILIDTFLYTTIVGLVKKIDGIIPIVDNCIINYRIILIDT